MRKALLAMCLSLWACSAAADTVSIDVTLDFPAEGRYRLAGQSAFIQTRTSSGTTGGQLDWLESGISNVTFTELFPEPSLSDYLGFAYFGIIETLDEFDDVLDTSMIVAFSPGFGVGETIADRFLFNEADLVTALTTSFDSPEFFDFLNAIGNDSDALGEIAVPSIGRPGTVLDLVAYVGGNGGDEGVKVGTLAVTVVPEPGTLGMLLGALAALLVVGRRRK